MDGWHADGGPLKAGLQPLAGVVVADFSELAPGPFLTQCLAELGATVTKVERPPHGDGARVLSPGGHRVLNVDKRTVMLDLKSDEGLADARELVRSADVFVEGYRPGVMARLGLGYEQVRALRLDVVYVSITGYGQVGPYVADPGHDINYLARSGFLALTGLGDGTPRHVLGTPIGDFFAGLYALSATVAALHQRAMTGEGCWLDVSIVDSLTHVLNARLGHFQDQGMDDLVSQQSVVLAAPGYGVFEAADGAWVSIAALEDHFWQRLVDVLGLDLTGLPPHGTLSERRAASAAINDVVAAGCRRWPAAELVSMLLAKDVPAAPVVIPTDLPHTEHAMARDLFAQVDGYDYARFPVRLGSATVTDR